MGESIKTEQLDIYRTSRLFYVFEAAVEYFLSIFVGGTYLAKMTMAIGISDSLTGIISAFVSLGFGFQIFALLLARKRPFKPFIITMNLLTQFAFSFLYVIPVLNIKTTAKTVIFICFFLFAEVIKNIVYSPKTAWLMGVVDDSKRGIFTAKKESFSLLSGIVVSVTMGNLIDHLEAAGNQRGVFILGGITMFFLAVMHTTLLLLIKEKPERVADESLMPCIHKSVTDKKLLVLIPLFAFWNIATYSTVPFYGTYQLNDLGMNMTTVTLIAAIGSIVRAVVSTPIGKIADKYSFIKSLNICFVLALVAHAANIFAGVVFYTFYVILQAAAMAGINSGIVNLVYDFVPKENRTGALAVKNTLVGFAGFFTTLVASLLVEYIQGNENKFLFFESVYAQQVLSAFSVVMITICIVYLNLVVKRAKPERLVEVYESMER